jgi:hypothetical protein
VSALTDFLLTRIAEDEAVAQSVGSYPDSEPWSLSTFLGDWGENERWVVEISRRRVLAECEAKRQIVELARGIDPYGETDWADVGELDDAQVRVLADVLRALALPYADHPDYRDEWR